MPAYKYVGTITSFTEFEVSIADNMATKKLAVFALSFLLAAVLVQSFEGTSEDERYIDYRGIDRRPPRRPKYIPVGRKRVRNEH